MYQQVFFGGEYELSLWVIIFLSTGSTNISWPDNILDCTGHCRRSPVTITRRSQRKDKDSACSALCQVVRPWITHWMRLLEGLTVVPILWVRCMGEVLTRYSQKFKTEKNPKTSLATSDNQRGLAKGLEQHSVNIKHFLKHYCHKV